MDIENTLAFMDRQGSNMYIYTPEKKIYKLVNTILLLIIIICYKNREKLK